MRISMVWNVINITDPYYLKKYYAKKSLDAYISSFFVIL